MQRSGIPLHANHRIAQISSHQVSTGAVEGTITGAQAHAVRDFVTNARCNIVSVVSRHHCREGVAAEVARVRGECETTEALGEAHCGIVFPVAVQTSNSAELTAYAGIDPVSIAKVLYEAGAEVGRQRRAATGGGPLRTALDVKCNRMAHARRDAKSATKSLAGRAIQNFVRLTVTAEVNALSKAAGVFQLFSEGMRVSASGRRSDIGIALNAAIKMGHTEADPVTTAHEPAQAESTFSKGNVRGALQYRRGSGISDRRTLHYQKTQRTLQTRGFRSIAAAGRSGPIPACTERAHCACRKGVIGLRATALRVIGIDHRGVLQQVATGLGRYKERYIRIDRRRH